MRHWKYDRLGKLVRRGRLLWPADPIRPCGDIEERSGVIGFCDRFAAVVQANPTPFIHKIENELATIDPPVYYKGARLFDLRTGLEIAKVPMSFDRLNPWHLAVCLFRAHFHRVMNLQSITPILVSEGALLHLAIDAEITPYPNAPTPELAYEAEIVSRFP